jgi:hypothetical protein
MAFQPNAVPEPTSTSDVMFEDGRRCGSAYRNGASIPEVEAMFRKRPDGRTRAGRRWLEGLRAGRDGLGKD